MSDIDHLPKHVREAEECYGDPDSDDLTDLHLKVERLERELADTRQHLAAARGARDAFENDVDTLTAERDAARAEVEAAFRAGYHCYWLKDSGRYIFDPAMKPGDPGGAYAAWSRYQQERGQG